MTRTSSSSSTITLLLIISFLHMHDASALVSDGVTLLSLFTDWTFVLPFIINSSSWNASDATPCSWVGVQCDHAHNVISLNLAHHGIFGQLGPQIGNLHHLKTLVLLGNGFNGEVPSQLSNCSLLEHLDLSGNNFSGKIPPNLCSGKQLLELNMGINQLQGGIPSDVGRCVTLRRLILTENNFTGSLPDFESNPNLIYMDMSKNIISGTIPSSFGNCTNLTEINLSMNKFTGLIPSELGKLLNLVILDLAHNNLEGPLPPQLSNCTKMDRFDVGFNFLNGSLPSSLRSWRGITTLVLSENHFTGGIPGFLAEFNNLRELQLGGNLFGGKIPRSIGTMQNLFYGLNLSANGLTGDIPSEIGELEQLQSLDISSNNLTGSIDFLESLISLIEVNISFNSFNGSVPGPTLLLKLLCLSPSSFTANPLLYVNCSNSIVTSSGEPSDSKPDIYKSVDHKDISKFELVMIELGSSIFIFAMLLIIIRMYLHRRSEQELNEQSVSASHDKWSFIERGGGRIGFIYEHEVKISAEKNLSALQDLVLEATENLNDQYIIGRGAHGIVYKAKLGQQVFAVKKVEFGRNKQKRLSIMRKEIEILGMCKHRNLVTYADYWIGGNYGLVLYEFMENGSLHDILHEKKPPPPLTWNVRFKIAVGIAQGLAYLHYDCTPPIVHRDIKPKNILLDVNMEPIIADFGIAIHRKLSEHSYSHSETRQMLSSHVAGTPGYIAPENAYAIVQSRKSDVYSYGVVLLELITRKGVLVPSLNDEAEVTNLVSWARSVWLETGKIEQVVDSYLASAFPNSVALVEQVTEMLLLALRCTERDLRDRPTMKDVIGLYKKDLFKQRCDDVDYGDEVATNTAPQPYNSFNPFPDVLVVSIDHHLHGESSRAAAQRQREVTFNVETDNDFSFWEDANQFQLRAYDWDDWKLMSRRTTGIDGLVIKLMDNGKILAEKVVVAAQIVPKITYAWPHLIFLPSVIGPVLTKPFNWFFLSRWAQYMHLQKSLYSQPKSYFINSN